MTRSQFRTLLFRDGFISRSQLAAFSNRWARLAARTRVTSVKFLFVRPAARRAFAEQGDANDADIVWTMCSSGVRIPNVSEIKRRRMRHVFAPSFDARKTISI